jgi:superfamily II DNA or RNA helicase
MSLNTQQKQGILTNKSKDKSTNKSKDKLTNKSIDKLTNKSKDKSSNINSKAKTISKSILNKSKSKSYGSLPQFAIQLKPHQQKVVEYMWKTDSRGIVLYHGLGSGKTITSIAISQLYPEKKVIVVCPASMRIQWKNELGKMKAKMENYKILSYEAYASAIKTNANMVDSSIVILDEAHRIRNPGKTSTVINRTLKDSDKVILLTGTPMVNTPLDMSPLVNIIMGNKIMPVEDEQFEDHFMITKSMELPPMKDRCFDYSAITCSDKGYVVWHNRCTYHYYKYMLKQPKEIRDKEDFYRNSEYEKEQENRINKMREKLKFIPKQPNLSQYARYVRCMVSYYMPDLTEDYPKVEKWFIKVHMSKMQSDIYLNALQNLPLPDREAMERGIQLDAGKPQVNTFLNVVRRVSNTWGGFPNTPKLRQIIKYIIEGPKPVIVYSNWLEDGIEALAKSLVNNKISFAKFTGALNDKTKNDVVELYNKGDIDVLLLSSSGGEGLDLKNTRQIHIMEPHWNFAKINQVIGRGVRYKSHENLPLEERKVTVYYWISIPDMSSLSSLNNSKKSKSVSRKKDITRKSGNTHTMGADEYLYQVGQNKMDNMEKFLETLVGYSIENNPNCLIEKETEKKRRQEEIKKKLEKDKELQTKTLKPKLIDTNHANKPLATAFTEVSYKNKYISNIGQSMKPGKISKLFSQKSKIISKHKSKEQSNKKSKSIKSKSKPNTKSINKPNSKSKSERQSKNKKTKVSKLNKVSKSSSFFL